MARGPADLWRARPWVLNHVVNRVPLIAPRMRLYARFGVRFEDVERSAILLGTQVWAPSKVSMGLGAIINRECRVDANGGVDIGRWAMISHGVRLQTGKHDHTSPDFTASYAPIVVGAHAWLCEASMVLGGVTIGEGAVVSGGAVVTRDVEPFAIVGGVPARVIGERPHVRPEPVWRPNFL